MRNEYRRQLQTPAVEAAQRRIYGRSSSVAPESREPGRLGPEEVEFVEQRDSFYMATTSESGWPYVQHRGGEPGFLKVVGERRLAFADLEGNRQMISVGNLAGDDRVSLFLMDYRARERLKLIGRAKVVSAEEDAEAAERLGVSGAARMMVIDVVGFDWNCPKYITQRFTREEVEAYAAPLKQRIEELETALEEATGRGGE